MDELYDLEHEQKLNNFLILELGTINHCHNDCIPSYDEHHITILKECIIIVTISFDQVCHEKIIVCKRFIFYSALEIIMYRNKIRLILKTTIRKSFLESLNSMVAIAHDCPVSV